MSEVKPGRIAASVFTCALIVGSGAAHAGDVDFIDMFRNVGFMQTGNGNNLGDNGAFFTTVVFTLGGVAYSGGTVSFAGAPSPAALTPQAGNTYGYQSNAYASKAAMDAAFPQGSYSYALQSAGPLTQASFSLGADQYALSRPYLSGTSYAALQGAQAGAPLALSFSAYTVNPAASEALMFFTVYDYTTAQFVFDAGFLPATTPGLVLSGNLLQAGHQYAYELIYSSRVRVPASGTNFDAQIGFELRTTGQFFTAAVPEPGAWGLMLSGLAVVAWRGCRQRHAHAR